MAIKKVRFGIVGMGGVGVHHAKYMNAINGAVLTAFSSRDPGRLAASQALFPDAKGFVGHEEMLGSGLCDAVLIATPHYQHVPIAVEALQRGLHVLVEKPLAVSVAAARVAVEAAQKRPELLFGIMLNQRTLPLNQKIKALIAAGELGAITRISWTATHWFRPNCYYTASPWRATWAGEGGGVLINQCHHNLDLLYWMTGMMPRRVTAVGFLGKQHPIETEDEVSAILEYDNGAIGHFFASTGEVAGVNRLEIAGTRGKVVAENDQLTLARVGVDGREFLRTSNEPFKAPAVTRETMELMPAPNPDHKALVENFVKVVQAGGRSDDLLAPAADDLPALALSNAIMQAGVIRKPVELPLDETGFEAFLAEMIRKAPGAARGVGL